MRYPKISLLLLLLAFIGYSSLLCSGDGEGCDCTSRVTRVKPYSGELGKTELHYSMGDVKTLTVSCGGGGCSYNVTAKVWLHNPTQKKAEASVFCLFKSKGGYEYDKATRGGISVPATASRGVELTSTVQAPYGAADSLTADCEAAFSIEGRHIPLSPKNYKPTNFPK